MRDSLSFTVRPGDCRGKGPRLDQALLAALSQADQPCSDQCATANVLTETALAADVDEEEELGTESVPVRRVPLSRETVKKAIAEGLCTRNGTVCTQASTRLKPGDAICLTLPAQTVDLVPEDGPVTIIWEDSDVLVLSKPANLTVHPCPSCPSGTLIQRVARVCPEIAAMGGLRPGIVHRLDKETSGLMLVARNEETRLALTKAFADRTVHKEYLAVVSGETASQGRVEDSIGRDPQHKTRMACVPLSQGGRTAQTEYTTLWTSPDKLASLVRVRIHTGRTHQIRVHMMRLGHPLLGDALYAGALGAAGKDVAAMAPRVMLHAFHLQFTHPRTGESMEFTLPPPQDIIDCLLERVAETQCLVLTGNPGCGKSTVRQLFAEAGFPCVSADNLVTGYYGPGGALSSWLGTRFGEDVLREDGSVDKTKLMAVFSERPDVRHEVEELVHRLVRGDIQDFFDHCRQKHLVRAVAEIPLYFECGWHKRGFTPAPLSVGIRAGLEGRKERLARTRGWSDEKSAAIESWQWEEERKLAACDVVLNNTAGLDELRTSFNTVLLPRLDSAIACAQSSFRAALDELWKRQGCCPATGAQYTYGNDSRREN